MQEDMHYYGTYAMARAAGINAKTAKIIATAAQFVDDNANKESIEIEDGARLDSEATAHHAANIKNIDFEDQRKIWVPFHFLPGNTGDTYTQRLICQKNSAVAKEMLDYSLSLSDQTYTPLLAGIAAHVYADTFSHYGFSGISSRWNKIEDIKFHGDLNNKTRSHLENRKNEFNEKYEKESGFLTNIKSWFAESLSGALGHGAAVTFPDRPYLKWSFKYEDPKRDSGVRDNPATFMEACQALYDYFRALATARPDYSEQSHTEFDKIQDTLKDIISLQGSKKERIAAWRNAAKDGKLFTSGSEAIPVYNANAWHNQRENLKREKKSKKINTLSIYHFYQAASIYRTYVLRVLLPSKGLIVT